MDEHCEITDDDDDRIHKDEFLLMYNDVNGLKIKWDYLLNDAKRFLTYDAQKRANNKRGAIMRVKFKVQENDLDDDLENNNNNNNNNLDDDLEENNNDLKENIKIDNNNVKDNSNDDNNSEKCDLNHCDKKKIQCATKNSFTINITNF